MRTQHDSLVVRLFGDQRERGQKIDAGDAALTSVPGAFGNPHALSVSESRAVPI